MLVDRAHGTAGNPRQILHGTLSLLLCLVLLADVAHSTTVVVPPEAEMLSRSDAVVLATIEEVRSTRSHDGRRFETEIVVLVREGYRGAIAGERLSIRETGGRVRGAQQWILGAPEFEVGETALLVLRRDDAGVLRTSHLAAGKIPVEIAADGRVWLTPTRRNGSGRVRETLSRFRQRVPRRVTRGRSIPPNPTSAIEGPSEAQSRFRLFDPASRWVENLIDVFGPLIGDAGLGLVASQRVVSAGAAAWNGVDGSALRTRHVGDHEPAGFVCHPDGGIHVSFDDPLEQIPDPTSCGSGTLAIGGICTSSQPWNGTEFHRITSGAVVVNDGWQNCGLWTEQNVSETMTHEIGHALGLQHSSDEPTTDPFLHDATMYFTARFDGRGARLAAYDEAAIAWLYPEEAPAPVPTPRGATSPDSSDIPWDGIVQLIDDLAQGDQRVRIQGRVGAATDLASPPHFQITLQGTDESYTIDIPTDAAWETTSRRSATYRTDDFQLHLRLSSGHTSFVLDLEARESSLRTLAAGEGLSVYATLGDRTEEATTECSSWVRAYHRYLRCRTG